MKIYLMDMIKDSRERQRERLKGAALGGKNVYTLTGKTAMDGRFEVIGEQQYYFGGTPMTHKLWIIWDYAAGSHLHLDFGGTWFRTKKDAVEALAEIAERVMQGELDDELRARLKKPLPEPVQAWW